jgi:hypothetical protein
MPNLGLERHEQKAVAQYMNYKGLFWCHVPNEGNRASKSLIAKHGPERAQIIGQTMAKSLGLNEGMPDNLIFSIPWEFYRNEGWMPRGVAFELKRKDKSAKPTQAQLERLEQLRQEQWLAEWFNGADDAIKWLQGLGW